MRFVVGVICCVGGCGGVFMRRGCPANVGLMVPGGQRPYLMIHNCVVKFASLSIWLHIACNETNDPDLHPQTPRRAAGGDPAAHRRSRRRAARQRRPRATTISMIAERAGVQRHTFYAHFPDDRSLFMACSGLVQERDPLPDAARGGPSRIGASGCASGLSAIYDWYERNAALMACVLRDAEYHPLTREIAELRFGPHRGLSRGARREAEREAARGAAAGAELLHLADAGARGPEARRCR